MRVEFQYGNYVLCGGIIAAHRVEPGQVWQSSGGGEVTVLKAGDWVEYEFEERGVVKTNTKDNFSFQVRHCLVLPNDQLPEWAMEESK